VPDRVDFSRNVTVYDRRHGAFLPADAARELARLAGLRPDSRVLELGAGTGRVALPLAEAGCRVIGLDISHAMLVSLRGKTSAVRVPVVVGDGAQLPIPNAGCDAVVVARLLYLVPDWRRLLDEARRVLKPGGCLLHEWGNGAGSEEWVQIRERARALFEQAGIAEPFHPGARNVTDVDAHLLEHGFETHAVRQFDADVTMTLRQFLDRIVSGECSYTWKVPTNVRQRSLCELVAWAVRTFDLSHVIANPVVWRIHCKTA
jgi:ubiquinone/menaquinone biosynthesis C-methylase UbiE